MFLVSLPALVMTYESVGAAMLPVLRFRLPTFASVSLCCFTSLHALRNDQNFCFHAGMHFNNAHASFDLWAENSLQMINPAVSLPYWDYTKDTAELGAKCVETLFFPLALSVQSLASALRLPTTTQGKKRHWGCRDVTISLGLPNVSGMCVSLPMHLDLVQNVFSLCSPHDCSLYTCSRDGAPTSRARPPSGMNLAFGYLAGDQRSFLAAFTRGTKARESCIGNPITQLISPLPRTYICTTPIATVTKLAFKRGIRPRQVWIRARFC